MSLLSVFVHFCSGKNEPKTSFHAKLTLASDQLYVVQDIKFFGVTIFAANARLTVFRRLQKCCFELFKQLREPS